jgi:hypothetical protein
MGAGYSTTSGSGDKSAQGMFIRPGDDFIILGQRKGRTWAIQSSKRGAKDVVVSQVANKGVKVSDHRLQYQAKCADDKRESPSSGVLHPTAADKVNYTSSVLLKSGVDSMHPKGGSVEWLGNDADCLSRLERFSFVSNNPKYPTGAPLSGDTDVNIRVYNIGSKQQRALQTPNSDDSTTKLKIKDKVSSWKLYRTKGWVLEGGQCKPWSIGADNIQRDLAPYTCNFPKQENGGWQVRCFTTAGRDSLFSTEEECLAYKGDQDGGNNGGNNVGNGGGNNGGNNGGNDGGNGGGNGGNDGGNGGGNGGGNDGGNGGDKPDPKKAEETDGTVVWVVVGSVLFIMIIAILAMLARQ